MTRVMIHVAGPGDIFQPHSLLQKVLVDVHDLGARKYTLEFIPLELIEAGSAADHDGFDVEVVERVGDPVKQHTVVGGALLLLVEFAGPPLRIAAAQISGRQHGLHADVPQHRLSRETDLRKQALRAPARKVKHRFGIAADLCRVADDGHVVAVFDVEECACGPLRQAAGYATWRACAAPYAPTAAACSPSRS